MALFISPNPPKYKKDYLYMVDFIFPNKELFLNFLEEDNTERQISIAKDILLCLVYDSHFAPPTRLLFNILDMDSSDLNEKIDTYIKRDHFVHLVHSYLLGVYIYFYHSPINEKVTKLFMLKRNKKRILDSSLNLSAKKDAIIAWRYFVLFHDLTYPFEYYLGMGIDDDDFKKKQDRYLKAFRKIPKSLGKDLVFKSLSKIIAINNLNAYCNEESFDLLVRNYLVDENNDKEYSIVKNTNGEDVNIVDITSFEKWIDAQKLTGIFGYKTLKNIVKIFPKEKILSVLFDSDNCPIVLYVPKNIDAIDDDCEAKPGRESHEVYLTKYYKKRKNNSILSASFPFDDERYNSNYYTLGYFYIEPQKQIDTFLSYLFTGVDKDDYQDALVYFTEMTKTKAELITTEDEFQQYCFEIYLSLYKSAGYYKYMEDDPSISSFSVDNIAQEINKLNNNTPKAISSIINKILQKELPSDKYFQLTGKDANESVLQIFNLVFNDYDGLIEKISSSINNDIVGSNSLVSIIRTIREVVGDKFRTDYSSTIFNEKEPDTLNVESFLNSIIDDSLFKIVDKKIADAGISSIKELINNYVPDYFDGEKYFDHGIWSSLLMIEILDTYENILSCENSDANLLRLKNLSIDTDISQWARKKDYKKNDILAESCYAIAIHNLYPSYLNNKKYKTDLLRSPFAYFAILVDTLQPWDRKNSINQAYMELPYITTSDNFNIEIVKNKIRITEIAVDVQLEVRLDQLKNNLNQFLKNASDNVEIILAGVK